MEDVKQQQLFPPIQSVETETMYGYWRKTSKLQLTYFRFYHTMYILLLTSLQERADYWFHGVKATTSLVLFNREVDTPFRTHCSDCTYGKIRQPVLTKGTIYKGSLHQNMVVSKLLLVLFVVLFALPSMLIQCMVSGICILQLTKSNTITNTSFN